MTDLMSRKGREAVRRGDRGDAVERYRWPLTVVGALGVGVANYIGLIFAGVPTRESLVIGAGIALMIVGFYVVLAVVTRRRVTPVADAGQSGPPDDRRFFERLLDALSS